MRDSDTTAPAQGGEADAPSPRPREETARLGDEIYDKAIRPQVEADHHGEIVAIDVDSGDYAVAENVVTAWERLAPQHPGGSFWFVRVGYPTVYHLGGRPLGRPS